MSYRYPDFEKYQEFVPKRLQLPREIWCDIHDINRGRISMLEEKLMIKYTYMTHINNPYLFMVVRSKKLVRVFVYEVSSHLFIASFYKTGQKFRWAYCDPRVNLEELDQIASGTFLVD